MTIGAVEASLSPSMDIQVSSNFERFLFELKGRRGAAAASAMQEFRASGRLPVARSEWEEATRAFSGCRVDDEATRRTIAAVWRETGELLDPHSAIGVAAARARRGDPAVPMVALACAHAAKFPEAVEAATGRRPSLPAPLADLMDRPERVTVLPKDLAAVQGFVRSHAQMAVGREAVR
jgi:threonine synthase